MQANRCRSVWNASDCGNNINNPYNERTKYGLHGTSNNSKRKTEKKI